MNQADLCQAENSDIERNDAYKNIFEFAHELTLFKKRCKYQPVQVSKTLFEYANFSEPQISWVIREILAYHENDNYLLLQSFLDDFFPAKHVVVKKPFLATEYSDIDICVIDEDYVLIIENKIKGAVFQHNQMARYLHWAETYHQDKKVLAVILSKTASNKGNLSTWRFPKRGFTSCRIDNIRCKCDETRKICDESQCILYDEYVKEAVVLTDAFAFWIEDISSLVLYREKRLYSMMLQFADYLKTIYNIDINFEHKMEMQKFVKNYLGLDEKSFDFLPNIYEKIEETRILCSELENLSKEIKGNFIEECYARMRRDYDYALPGKTNKDECGINLEYKGKHIWAYIKIEDNGIQPVYGLWMQNITADYMNDINDNILNKLNLQCVSWGGTDAGVAEISSFKEVYGRFVELVEVVKNGIS